MIERFHGQFTPYCGGLDCEAELQAEETWQDAVDAVKAAGWTSKKDEKSGDWEHYCKKCKEAIPDAGN
jgi:hypothetical protein